MISAHFVSSFEMISANLVSSFEMLTELLSGAYFSSCEFF
jgi:hypothetical protein